MVSKEENICAKRNASPLSYSSRASRSMLRQVLKQLYVGSKLPQVGSKLPHVGSMLAHVGSMLAHVGSKMASNRLKMGQESSKVPQIGSSWLRVASRVPQRRFWR
jgi:hypothetical protein